MYSKDIFLERAQQALLDGGIVFSAFLAAAVLRHSGVILDPGSAHHFAIGPYLFPATLLATAFGVARPGSTVGFVGIPHDSEVPIDTMFSRN